MHSKNKPPQLSHRFVISLKVKTDICSSCVRWKQLCQVGLNFALKPASFSKVTGAMQASPGSRPFHMQIYWAHKLGAYCTYIYTPALKSWWPQWRLAAWLLPLRSSQPTFCQKPFTRFLLAPLCAIHTSMAWTQFGFNGYNKLGKAAFFKLVHPQKRFRAVLVCFSENTLAKPNNISVFCGTVLTQPKWSLRSH